MASNYFRPVVLIAAIISLAQSIAWFVMSLLAILSYRCNLNTPDSSDKSAQFMVYLYFQGTDCPVVPLDPTWKYLKLQVWATPIYLHGWMCTYLTFNVTYFFIALSMLVQLCRTPRGGSYPLSVIRLWSLNTLAFLIMDLWLTIVFGLDFGSLEDFVNSNSADSLSWTASVPGALMAMSARGFVLYVINLALFCYLLCSSFNWRAFTITCCQVQVTSNSREELAQNYQDDQRYGSQSLPRVKADWDNGQVLVPVNAARWNDPRPTVGSHPNAVEGVTSFNDWYGPTRPQKFYDDNVRAENKSVGRARAPSPPRRVRQDEEVFHSRPSVRSTFEYPDRRNFEQGGNKSASRPFSSAVKNSDFY